MTEVKRLLSVHDFVSLLACRTAGCAGAPEGGTERCMHRGRVKEHLSGNGPSNCLSPEYKPLSDNKDGRELFKAAMLLGLVLQKGWNGIFS